MNFQFPPIFVKTKLYGIPVCGIVAVVNAATLVVAVSRQCISSRCPQRSFVTTEEVGGSSAPADATKTMRIMLLGALRHTLQMMILSCLVTHARVGCGTISKVIPSKLAQF